MVELVVRLVFSLGIVLGLLMVLIKFSSKRFSGSTDALVRVVHRQPLSRTSSIAVVTVGSRVLVIGTTEQQVALLTELDPEELEDLAVDGAPAAELAATPEQAPASAPAPAAGTHTGPLTPAQHGALAGSILSAQTWRQALAAATRKDKVAS